jgi:hypothetical protein
MTDRAKFARRARGWFWEKEITALLCRASDEARAEERARIAAWLRGEASVTCSPHERVYASLYADRIEAMAKEGRK